MTARLRERYKLPQRAVAINRVDLIRLLARNEKMRACTHTCSSSMGDGKESHSFAHSFHQVCPCAYAISCMLDASNYSHGQRSKTSHTRVLTYALTYTSKDERIAKRDARRTRSYTLSRSTLSFTVSLRVPICHCVTTFCNAFRSAIVHTDLSVLFLTPQQTNGSTTTSLGGKSNLGNRCTIVETSSEIH